MCIFKKTIRYYWNGWTCICQNTTLIFCALVGKPEKIICFYLLVDCLVFIGGSGLDSLVFASYYPLGWNIIVLWALYSQYQMVQIIGLVNWHEFKLFINDLYISYVPFWHDLKILNNWFFIFFFVHAASHYSLLMALVKMVHMLTNTVFFRESVWSNWEVKRQDIRR